MMKERFVTNFLLFYMRVLDLLRQGFLKKKYVHQKKIRKSTIGYTLSLLYRFQLVVHRAIR